MTAQDEIRETVARFTRDMEALVRDGALASVARALGVAPDKSDGPMRALPQRSSAPPARQPRASRSVGRRAVGRKRGPKEIAALQTKVVEWLAKHPGNGVEAIAAALGLRSAEVVRPVKQLVGERRITKTGQKRATRYTAA